MRGINSFREAGARYPALRLLAFFCTLVGAVLIVLGTGLLVYGIQVIASVVAGSPPPNLPLPADLRPQLAVGPAMLAWACVLWSFGILFSGVQLVGLGAIFRLMIHLEENTRASAQLLDRIRSRLEADPKDAEAFFRS